MQVSKHIMHNLESVGRIQERFWSLLGVSKNANDAGQAKACGCGRGEGGVPEAGDGAPSVPKQAPATQAAIKRCQVVPHTIIPILHIYYNHLQHKPGPAIHTTSMTCSVQDSQESVLIDAKHCTAQTQQHDHCFGEGGGEGRQGAEGQ